MSHVVDPKVNLTGMCQCGGKIIPHPRKALTWICERSRWWNRKRGHAYLIGRFETLPPPQGEA
jgi:hypothetical protein